MKRIKNGVYIFTRLPDLHFRKRIWKQQVFSFKTSRPTLGASGRISLSNCLQMPLL